jgi:transcription termination factor NusA
MSSPDDSPSAMFTRTLRMPQALAEALVAGEVTSVEELAYIPLEELLTISAVGRESLVEWRETARQHLLGSL